MSGGRSLRWVALVAGLLCGGRAGAAVQEGSVVSVHIVSSPAEARETREVLADLLSRIGIGIADAPPATRPSLVDVEIDLSTAHGGPFVALTTREPPAIICRRGLSPQASREVLIESAAEVAYAAIESRARAVGILRSGTGAAAGEPAGAGPRSAPAPGSPPPQPEITVAGDAAALETQATGDAPVPGYGVDAAAFVEMQLRGARAELATAGGGAAVTFSWRGVRLAPALVLGLSYLRSIGVEDPAAPANLSTVATRLGASVNAFASRWISVQLGPTLALDVVRGDAPAFTSGPGPMMGPMPMAGATESFSGLAIWAGGTVRLSLRVAPSSHIFLAAGGDYQLRRAGPRPVEGTPPNGAIGGPAQWTDAGPSGWRSSFLVGLTFTLAGRPLMTD